MKIEDVICALVCVSFAVIIAVQIIFVMELGECNKECGFMLNNVTVVDECVCQNHLFRFNITRDDLPTNKHPCEGADICLAKVIE